MIKNLIQILKNDNILIDKKNIVNFNKNSNPKDSIYPISVFIFENPKINHNTRLKCHLELIKISKQKRCNFSIAHNLNLSSRVYSVLGFNNEAIKNDLDALKIWKKIKNEPLAINGEISSYANLGYIYLELGLFKKALLYSTLPFFLDKLVFVMAFTNNLFLISDDIIFSIAGTTNN